MLGHLHNMLSRALDLVVLDTDWERLKARQLPSQVIRYNSQGRYGTTSHLSVLKCFLSSVYRFLHRNYVEI